MTKLLTQQLKHRLLPLGLFVTLATTARADFVPIPLAPGSFNRDMIIERGAPPPVQTLVTANMDAGTNLSGTVGGTGGNQGALYEMGFSTTSGSGLPYHGSTFNAVSNTAHQFRMAPDYRKNNAIYVGAYGSAVPQVETGSLTLTTPAAYSHLSFLTAAGGATVVSVQVGYNDGSIDYFTLNLVDWWTTNNANTATTAWIANGSFQGTDGSYQRINTTPQNARLFFNDVVLSYPSTPVTNLLFTFVSGGRAAIFGVSGSTDGTTFQPITVTGFNHDMILEAPLATVVTASMDGGLLTANNRAENNTWFEQGFNLLDLTRPWVGLLPPGTSFNAWSNTAHMFKMPSSYKTNCAIMVNSQIPSATFTLANPTALSAVSILSSSGNGPVNVNLKIYHQDGSFETTNYFCLDWFANQTYSTNWNVAFSSGGRTTVGRRNVLNDSGTVVSKSLLFFSDIALANTTSPVTSVEFSYASGGRTAIFGLSGSTDNVNFSPLAVSGYNVDLVVEAEAITNTCLRSYVSGSMDGGTNRNGNCWHEVGYNPLAPSSGLPAAGSVLTSTNLPDHHYQFASSYTGPNAVYCDSNNPVATITFAQPTNYSVVSFLSATANGGIQVQVILNHDDGSKETNVFTARDWFNNTPAAFTANGRVNADSCAVNNFLPGTTNPRLYEAQFQLQDVVHNVTGATLIWTTNNGSGGMASTTSRFVVLAVSGVMGAAPPILATAPTSVVTMEGSNAVLSATLSGGTTPITYKWEYLKNNTWTPVVNGGSISGATSTNLTFTNISWTNSTTYRFIASNVGGSVTSSVATILAYTIMPDVTQPSDPVAMYNGATTAGEGVAHVIDNVGQKYLNFGFTGAAPFVGPVGFVVTPTLGNTVVSAIRVYTANDSSQRDPADYTLEGSNDGGNTWLPIASGSLTLSTDRNAGASASVLIGPPFTNAVAEVHFPNTTAYSSYRWSVNNVRDNSTATCMQVAEVELLGVGVGTRPSILVQPQPAVKVFVGASPVFTVSAFGYPTNLAYQWYKSGTPIAGATSPSYTLSNAQLADSTKVFTCTVTNVAGAVTSSGSTLTVLAAPTAKYAQAILQDNPLGYWRLNEADDGLGDGGVLASDYWGGHNGVYTNVTLGQPGYTATPADADTSCLFGYTPSGYVMGDSFVGGISGIDFAKPVGQNAAFSVEAWAKGDVQLYDAGIITKGTGGGGEQFCLDAGATAAGSGVHGMRFYVRSTAGTVYSANTGTNVWDSNWHHLVGVCDEAAGTVTLYVDGLVSSQVSFAPSNGLLSSSSPVTIGSRRSNDNTNYNNQFYGPIDEVAIYGYALTSTQVLNHFYAIGVPPTFIAQPTNTTVSENSTAIIYANIYGSPTLSYQWYRSLDSGASFQPVAGQTGPNLVLPNVPLSAAGFYRVTVHNSYGDTTSDMAQLTVMGGAPQLASDLSASNVVYVGQSFSLAAAFLGTAPLAYTWQHNGAPVADSFRISGAQSNVLTVLNAQVSDAGTYQLFARNSQGGPVGSSLATIVVLSTSFNTTGPGWGLNGTPAAATINNGVLSLTSGAGSTARSAWFPNKQYIGCFEAWFTYQDVGGAGADGMAFVLQNDTRGLTALGGSGGSLGVGGITPSAEFEFNIYANNTPGLAFHTGGATGGYSATGPVNVASGNPISVYILYRAGQAVVALTDLTTLATYTTTLATGDIPTAVGGQTAYVGFTASDGGTVSTQTISDFRFAAVPTLSAQTANSSTSVLSWPADLGTGYVLQQCADLAAGAWQPVALPVTQTGGQNQVVVPTSGTRFYRLVLAF